MYFCGKAIEFDNDVGSIIYRRDRRLDEIERSRLSNYGAVLEYLLSKQFADRLRACLLDSKVTCVHALPLGPAFWSAYRVAQELGVRFVFNIHDDPRVAMPRCPIMPWLMARFREVWLGSDARVVVSRKMGNVYSKSFGDRPFSVIGATVDPGTITVRPAIDECVRPYFGGSVHLSYHINFKDLIAAMGKVAGLRGVRIHFVCRGGTFFSEAEGITIESKGWAPHLEYLQDFNNVDFGYVPLPFSENDRLFSECAMPVKMVSYLSQGLPILYHGPADTAVAALVATSGCGIAVTSRSINELSDAIVKLHECREGFSSRAAMVGREAFCRSSQQAEFARLLKGN